MLILRLSTFLLVFCAFVGGMSLPSYSMAKLISQEKEDPKQAAFTQWLSQCRERAITQENIRPEVFDSIASTIHFDPDVIRAYHRQPELIETLDRYLQLVVTEAKIKAGREKKVTHQKLLEEVEEKYHVDQNVIVAIWGIESFYGKIQGKFNVPQALATLASSGLKKDFATKEFLVVLKLLNDKSVTLEQLKGSWAGAMGQGQFIPSSHKNYAVDFDGDGLKDIWHSVPDALASIANYLHEAGRWQHKAAWGAEVEIEEKADLSNAPVGLASLEYAAPLAQWQERGVKLKAPVENLPGDRLYLLYIKDANRYFLVSENFKAILTYNKHAWYALAVGIMSDQY